MSINVLELRIRNFVSFINKQGELQKDEISAILGSGSIATKNYDFRIDEEDLKPIPLTEKILVDVCGFKGNDAGQGFELLLRLEDENRYLVFNDRGLYFSNELFYLWVAYYCKSLHQLQNIFFTLTNTELEINEEKLKSIL